MDKTAKSCSFVWGTLGKQKGPCVAHRIYWKKQKYRRDAHLNRFKRINLRIHHSLVLLVWHPTYAPTWHRAAPSPAKMVPRMTDRNVRASSPSSRMSTTSRDTSFPLRMTGSPFNIRTWSSSRSDWDTEGELCLTISISSSPSFSFKGRTSEVFEWANRLHGPWGMAMTKARYTTWGPDFLFQRR